MLVRNVVTVGLVCLSSGLACADEPNDGTLAEVIVTAQKREERLRDVPISITALAGKDLDRSTERSVADALNGVPGVISAISNGNARIGQSAGQVVVRGVAAGIGGSTTAYYLDSIPFGFNRASIAPDAAAYDLERIEVLRGPQGTLYGSSALNGVVRVLTKDADLEQFELKARASTSSTEASDSMNYRGDMAVNVPIIEGKLAARAVVGYQDWAGWIDKPLMNRKDANDSQLANYRLKVNAQPTEQLSVALSAWLSRSDVGAPSLTPNGRTTPSIYDEPSYMNYDAYGLKVGYDFSSFAVNSMTSYLDFTNLGTVDYTPFIALEKTYTGINSIRIFSQEAIVNSTGEGDWRWSFGAMYREADDKAWAWRSLYTAPTELFSTSQSVAVFGETTRAFFDGRLELTGGLRYFEDRLLDTERSRFNFIGGTINPATGLPGLAPDKRSQFEKTSPRLVLTWHPARQATLYASYGEGFRSGQNQFPGVRAVAPQYPPADPDDLKNYEIGAKWSLWNGRINVDTAAFYMDWQGVQQSVVVYISPSFPASGAIINAQSASGPGFELGITAEPLDGFTLSTTFSWNDLTVDHAVVGSNGTLYFAKGDRLYLSPKYTAGTSADYAFPVGSSLTGRVSLAANYTSEMRSGASYIIVRPTAEPVLMARASVRIESADHWTGTVYVDNLTNEAGLMEDSNSTRWYAYQRPAR